MPSFSAESQKLNPSAVVSLYELDATPVGGPVYYFTTGADGAQAVRFAGIDYVSVPIRISGMSVSGQGPIQTPTLSIGNTDGLLAQIISTYGDLEGCKLLRRRTYARFLDNGDEPDATAFYGPDVYVVDRKSSDTPEMIEWELAALADQQGIYVGRTVVRDTCMWRYRYWNTDTQSFDYSKATCPYAGTNYFDVNDEAVVNPEDDVPSRSLSCCQVRFGEDAALPFGGFPGVLRGAS